MLLSIRRTQMNISADLSQIAPLTMTVVSMPQQVCTEETQFNPLHMDLEDGFTTDRRFGGGGGRMGGRSMGMGRVAPRRGRGLMGGRRRRGGGISSELTGCCCFCCGSAVSHLISGIAQFICGKCSTCTTSDDYDMY
jgi:hypothetical protein